MGLTPSGRMAFVRPGLWITLPIVLFALPGLTGCATGRATSVPPAVSATPVAPAASPAAPSLSATGTYTPSPAPTSTRTPARPPTLTPLPTVTSTSSPATTSTPSPVPPGGFYFVDDFGLPSPSWPDGSDENGQAGHRVRGGAYEIWTAADIETQQVLRRGAAPPGDLSIEVTAHAAADNASLAYGVVFRAEPNKETAYSFMVSTAGAFTLGRQAGTDWIPLRDWTRSPAVRSGSRVNRLQIVASGKRLAGFVNGQLVVVLEDATLRMGAVGLLVANFSRSRPARVAFDHLSTRRLDQTILAAAFAHPPITPSIPGEPAAVLKSIPTALPIADEELRIAHGATVHLVSEGADGMARSGTGAVVGQDGRTLLTAFHVVGNPATGQLYSQTVKVGPFLDWQLTAHVTRTAPELDLAVLQVDPHPAFQGFAVVSLGDSDALDIGDSIYTLSYPGSGQGSLITTSGVVLGLYRDGPRTPIRFVVTNAQASPGSSGGVAVNRRGELVGIVSALILRHDILADLGYPDLKQATVLLPVNLARTLVPEAGQ